MLFTIDTKTDGLFPLPAEMSNETFLADTITGFDEIPARGPYTLALANMALYSSLADITPGYQSIVANIRNQVANDIAASFLPPSYREDPTMIAGYKHQLLALADFLENPEAPSLEGPYVTGGDTFLAIMLHPLSRGTVRLNAADILDQPELDYRSISNPIDLDIHLAHTKYLRRVFEMPTVQKYGPIVTEPPDNVQSDEDLIQWIKEKMLISMLHPCCTAAMMPREKGGVVGTDLRVHGVEGLRVADASVMPLTPSSHTCSSAYAIGEKASHSLSPVRIHPETKHIVQYRKANRRLLM